MDSAHIENLSLKILQELLQYRRCFPGSEKAIADDERLVTRAQLPRIRHFIEKHQRIEFVLPAFPSKSPNINKVLGPMPDMAERLSLIFLNSLCQRIQLYYPPGGHIIICSDGHVFGDLIRVSDEAIDAYQHEIENLLHDLGATYLRVFNLGDVYGLRQHAGNYDIFRQLLVKEYAESEEAIRVQLMHDEKGLLLYRAITRFLYEDSQLPGYVGPNVLLQKEAKRRALGVIQRSWAWGNLIANHFPAAIRLSIHPQPADSLKMGIHMMPTKDDWLTPWHGVAVNVNGQFVLMKNKDALQLQGQLVEIRGIPSHYIIERSEMSAQN